VFNFLGEKLARTGTCTKRKRFKLPDDGNEKAGRLHDEGSECLKVK
jgi:hypothetical protein